MSGIHRFMGRATPDAAQQRADMDEAIDAIARRRLTDAVRELDAAISEIRLSGYKAVEGRKAADWLLDVRFKLLAPMAPRP